MSHITTGRMKVKDLDALATAGKALGFVLYKGQTKYKTYYGLTSGVEHVLRTDKSEYEIGLVKAADGKEGWDLRWDAHGVHGRALESAAGPQLSRLNQEYGAAVTLSQVHAKLARQGFKATREMLPSGVLRMRLVAR